jgi:hypothetical protein
LTTAQSDVIEGIEWNTPFLMRDQSEIPFLFDKSGKHL